ncbi:MAG: hypothetical protein AB1716_10070 [Planctomycetota bacterium]
MRGRAVSVVEVVIALVVLGIVAAVTLPRFSRAATAGPDEETLLRDRLRVLRVAIERYYQDHRSWPGQHGDGQNAGGTAAAFVAQLMQRTDESGRIVTEEPQHGRLFGPYLTEGVPASPVGLLRGERGVHVIRGSALPLPLTAGESAAAWVYNCDTGQIGCNSTGRDAAGRSHAGY